MSIAVSIPENGNSINAELEIITGTGEILTDKKANGEERPFVKHKVSSLELHRLYGLAQIIDADCISKSSYAALEHCASFLLYGLNQKGDKRLKQADFCKARLCPMCNWRKSLKIFSQTSQITDYMLEQHPTTRFIFVTFSPRNCAFNSLEEAITAMNDAFSKLTAKSRKYAFSANFKKSLLGYMRAIEVTYNEEENTFHPHIHAIFAVKSSYFSTGYINHADWRKMWQEAMGLDYLPQVNVQTIKTKKKEIAPTAPDEIKTALVCAVAETAKYPVKMDGILDLPEKTAVEVIIALSKALRGKRLVVFGGLFLDCQKALKLDDVEDGDLIGVEGEEPINEVAQVLYKFHVKVGCYVC
jgi:plasmid rolling circle replication initiator protein Rep